MLALAGASLLVMGCASQGAVRDLRAREAARPNTVQAAIIYGEELNRIYIGQGSNLRSNRKWMGLGILAANTFVTAAAGLEAHADSIFAGALVGTTLRSLDPVLNAGGPDAWNAAHGRNVCVLAVAGPLNRDQVLADNVTLVGYAADPRYGELARMQSARLDAFPGRLVGAMDHIYARYLHDTTPDMPNLNDAINGAVADRAAKLSATEDAATLRSTMSNEELRSAFTLMGVEIVRAQTVDVQAAINRVDAALDYADAELAKCQPGQAVTDEAEETD
jgi:hypothetical protein